MSGQARPRRKRRMQRPEEWFSRAVKTLIESRGVEIRGEAFHVPNENPSKLQRQILSAMGVRAGVADWIFPGPPPVAIELKIGKRQLSAAQREFRERFLSGWPPPGELWDCCKQFNPRYVVCRRLRSVAEVLADARILTRPTDAVALDTAVKKVIAHYWMKHQQVIP